MEAADYSPLDPAVRRNPYPYYAALRRDAPVYEVAGMGLWVVARHADVQSIVRQPDRFSSLAMAAAARRPADFAPADQQSEMPPADAASLIGSDPPVHTRLRSIVNRGFTPRRIAALEGRIREIATGLARRLADRRECDLVADFAAPLPATVIAELLGMDPARHEDMKRWSDAIIRATFDTPRPDEAPHISRCFAEMTAHFDEVIAARQARPADDLISTLVRAESVDGALTVDEMNIFIGTLLVAGNVTTTNLIALGTLALLAHPAELAKVQQDLRLVPALVEEALRYDGPTQLLLRTATADVELAGTRIPAGALVAPLFASANRDERVFPEPDRFDVGRQAKDHLAFGYGAHFCLGAALARLEARVAFETLLPMLGRPVLLADELEWIESIALRGVRALPLRFEPDAVAAAAPPHVHPGAGVARCPVSHDVPGR
jgi:cytochrome P450